MLADIIVIIITTVLLLVVLLIIRATERACMASKVSPLLISNHGMRPGYSSFVDYILQSLSH